MHVNSPLPEDAGLLSTAAYASVERMLVCLVCGMLGGTAVAGAESLTATPDAYDLEEIVVTATRRGENAFAMPYTVNVQGMAELQQVRQIRTIPDAMRELPGVMVQKTGHGQGSPYIRGFTGLRTLFLIDGIRLNNSTFREGPNQYWNTIDPYSVWRLELLKGPSSVLYGSDAIGGTVNAISRAHSNLAANSGLQNRLILRGASAERSLVVRPEVDYANGVISIHAGLSLKTFGDLRAGSGTGNQPKTGYEEQDADLSIRLDLGDKRTLIAAFQHVDQDDAWRVHKTVFGQRWRGTTTGSELRRSFDQQRTLVYLQYQASDVATWLSELALSASYHMQNEERLRVRESGRFDRQGTDVGTFGLWGQVSMPGSVGLWTAGAEFYRDDVDSFRKDYDVDGKLTVIAIQGPVADDASYTTVATYLQNKVPLGDRADLQTGIRYTWSEADAKTVQDPQSGDAISIKDNWGKLTASIRYSRKLDGEGKTRVFAGVSQGFRAPNLSDLTRFDSARSNEIETPVSGLEHENFITYEVGTKFIRTRFDGQLSLFYTSIDKLIIRTPTGRIIDGENEITKRNAGSGFVKGIEFQGRYHFSNAWYLFGNLTWIDGEVDTFSTADSPLVAEPLDRLMPVRLYLGSRWQPLQRNFWLEGLLSVADQQSKLSTRDVADTDRIPPGGTPGYAMLTLRSGWKVSDSLQLSLSLENVFDKNYRIHGSGLNEPGRNLVLSLFWQPQQ